MKQSGRKALEPSLLLFRAEKQRDELLRAVRELQEDRYLAVLIDMPYPPEGAFRALVDLADRIEDKGAGGDANEATWTREDLERDTRVRPCLGPPDRQDCEPTDETSRPDVPSVPDQSPAEESRLRELLEWAESEVIRSERSAAAAWGHDHPALTHFRDGRASLARMMVTRISISLPSNEEGR